MEFVSAEEMVASAKMQLGIDNGDSDLYLRKLAIEAEKEIRSGLTISTFHVVGLPVNQAVAEMPSGFVKLVKLLGYTKDGGTKIHPWFLPSSFYRCEKESPNLRPPEDDPKRTSPRHPYYPYGANSYGQADGEFIQEYHPYTFQIQRGHIYFSDACDFDYIDLAYRGFNMDEYGGLLIPEHHERAVRSYIAYMYHLGDPYANQYVIERYRNDFVLAKQQVRGRDGLISREEAEFGRKVLNSVLPPRRMQY